MNSSKNSVLESAIRWAPV